MFIRMRLKCNKYKMLIYSWNILNIYDSDLNLIWLKKKTKVNIYKN